jgi:hypothetical protein
VAWTLKRWLISLFVAFHVLAVIVWIIPACAIKQRLMLRLAPYMLPLGHWQYWGMFAPNPIQDTMTVEAVVKDARGILRIFSFPKEADLSTWQKMVRFRHSKYTANFLLKDEFMAHREFAARHAIRRLGVPAEAFPVTVQLLFQIQPTPPPGGPPRDPMAPSVPSVIDTYEFPSLQEVLP